MPHTERCQPPLQPARLARGRPEGAGPLLPVQRALERQLGAGLPEDAVLGLRQAPPPLLLAVRHLQHTILGLECAHMQ